MRKKNKTQSDMLPVYLPVDVVMREAANSPELVIEDMQAFHDACIAAWNKFSEEQFNR